MDNATCNIVYVDRNVNHAGVTQNMDAVSRFRCGSQYLVDNLRLLRNNFGHGVECISTIGSLHDCSMLDLRPILVLIDIPFDEAMLEPRKSRSPSPCSAISSDEARSLFATREGAESEIYGLKLLERIVSEAQMRGLSRLVVPIPIIHFSLTGSTQSNTKPHSPLNPTATEGRPNGKRRVPFTPNRRFLKRCLDMGAIDVVTGPISETTLVSMEVHAYRAHKDAAKEQETKAEMRRGRKRSWVGVDEEKPFAYLREAMVSGLMNGICRVGGTDRDTKTTGTQLDVPADRLARISIAVGDWHFSAHAFSEDELVMAARIMFQHALAMPELERWRISPDQLTSFLVASRAAYNSFVPYHNFRHVVDVLQATFHILVSIGALAPYGRTADDRKAPIERSPIAALVEPLEALTLLVTAIGHDVGHPGVNNGFLTTLNAPLAQLYNDRSVLESFHCAAFSQILRRHWPAVFEDSKIRKLMISSILATDMGLHFEYMKKLGDTQEKLQERNSSEHWNGRMVEDQKTLVCSLIIKCADISNVARKHDTTLKWMFILNDEFSRQSSMEMELAIQSSLFAPPKKDPVALYQSQVGFMNIFAIPLFQGVADIMPTLRYTVDELETNKKLFEEKISQADDTPVRRGRWSSQVFSPRSLSLATPENQNFRSNSNGLTKATLSPALVEIPFRKEGPYSR